MREEVFGPILPVLEVASFEAVIDWVNSRPRPLGVYIFAEDDDVVEQILERTESGGACVNDCSIHPLVPELPFGGVGTRGWASTTATGASSLLRMPAVRSITARRLTPISSTRPTRST